MSSRHSRWYGIRRLHGGRMRRDLAPLIRATLAGAVVMAMPIQAHAVYEVCNPYSLQDFRDGMSAMEASFEEFDLNEARYQAEKAEKDARCISEPVTPQDMGRFARLRAQMFYLDSQTDSAAEWMLVKLAADGPSLPEDIGEEHPLRLVLRNVMLEDHEPVSGGQAVPPQKGIVLYNGRAVQDTTAWAGVKGLVQVFDKKGAYVEGFWVSGAEWRGDVRSEFVSAGAKPYAAPSWWTGQSHSKAPNMLKAHAIVTGMGGGDIDEPIDVDIPDTDPVVDTGGKDKGGKDGQADAGDKDKGDKDKGDKDKGDKPDKDKGDKPDKDKGDKPDKDKGDKPDKDKGDKDKGDKDAAVGPVKPPKDKGPKAPKPPKTPSSGPSTGMLTTGLGVLAVGGALWGVSAGLNGSEPSAGYGSSELASRRTTINLLSTGALAAGLVGVGLTTVAFVGQDGGGIRLRGRW